MASPVGFEPTTSRLGILRSIRMSYGDSIFDDLPRTSGVQIAWAKKSPFSNPYGVSRIKLGTALLN